MTKSEIKTRAVKMLQGTYLRIPIFIFALGLIARRTAGATMSLDIISTLNSTQQLLMQIGPILSAVLFVLAGIFYALGQLFPSYKRATLHSMSIDIIIGAIIVATLSVASNSLAIASTHLLSNATTSNTL